jgi:serine/threonine-protein kinase HipA
MCQTLSFPPSLKYESEGGPGIKNVLDFLQGSDQPEKDRLTFFRANIIFWLIGATDGHAKNFSVSLSTGGRFRLAPLYDVLTAQPSVDARQIRRNQMRLAMAVGNTRHYRINTIVPRHFEETAALSRLPKRSVQRVLEELRDTAAAATEAVMNSLPPNFPEEVAGPTAQGIGARLRLFV